MRSIQVHHRPGQALQRGLTLIEFMIAIVLGMILVAAIATLIANQSSNRAEVDRAGKLIENGRYAMQAITQDIEMAGYWGEIPTTPAAPATVPDPCATDKTSLEEAMGVHVQGIDGAATVPTCLGSMHVKPGTDILVVRHVDPDTSAIETAGVVDWAKMTAGQMYLQTGIDTTTNAFKSIPDIADGSTDSTRFYLKRRGGVVVASPRKYLVHIYYVATCDVCSGASADTIPTLKRLDLGVATPVTIAEGIESINVEYGRDTDADGTADGADEDGAAYTAANWADVMTAKVYLLARATEATPGYTDAKAYAMGTASAPAANDGYRRHVFVQSVRVVNPSSRRSN